MRPMLGAGMMDWLALSLAKDPSTVVLDAGLEWRGNWPAPLVLALLAGIVVLSVWIHRNRRLDLPPSWRVGLGILRAAVLIVPLLILLQPTLFAELERREARTLAVLMDTSMSLEVKDGTETVPTSRWDRATESLTTAMDMKTWDRGDMASKQEGLPRLATYRFGESIEDTTVSALPEQLAGTGDKRTYIGQALEQIVERESGQSLAGVLLLSDGADNSGLDQVPPMQAARGMARDGVPLHTGIVGNPSPRDASVRLTADSPYAFPEDPVPLRLRIDHEGFTGEQATVAVYVGDRLVDTKEITLPEGESATERFALPIEKVGRHVIRVEMGALTGELSVLNNAATVDVTIIDEPLRVLYVERWPRWQYHFLRNALLRDSQRVAADFVLLTEDPGAPEEERQSIPFPTDAESLKAYDVVILGDLSPQDLVPAQWDWLREHVVEDGAGLIVIAGVMHMPLSFLDSPLEPLLPFERVGTVVEEDLQTFHPKLTRLGTLHPLIRMGLGENVQKEWDRLPGWQWYANVGDLKPGAVVLVEREAEVGELPTPLMIAQRVGRGLTLFVGTDETWRWRYEIGNRYFYGFWGQAVQHVGMPHRVRAFESIRIETPGRPVVSDVPVPVSVSVDPTAGIATEDGETLTLIAQPETAAAETLSFDLDSTSDAPFVFQGSVALPELGAYRLFVEGYEQSGEAVLERVSTGGQELELLNPRVNSELMRQLAEMTSGQAFPVAELPAWMESLDLDPIRYRWSERLSLWDGWWMLGLLAALLTAEWSLRKWRYLP